MAFPLVGASQAIPKSFLSFGENFLLLVIITNCIDSNTVTAN